jgi:hypothetical protein
LIDHLLNSIESLDNLARLIQSGDTLEEEKSILIRQLNKDYRDWYTDCLASLPYDLHQPFEAEYEGSFTKRKIRSFLESALEIHPLYVSDQVSDTFPKWLYPYRKTFYAPIQQQRTILALAFKRAINIPRRTYGSKIFDVPSNAEIYKRDLFVLMPLIDEMKLVYIDHIAKVATAMELR